MQFYATDYQAPKHFQQLSSSVLCSASLRIYIHTILIYCTAYVFISGISDLQKRLL